MKTTLTLILTLLSLSLFAQNNVDSVYQSLEQDFRDNQYFQNSNLNLHRDGQMSGYVKELSPDYLFNNARPLTAKQIQGVPRFQFINYEAFRLGYQGYQKIKSKGLNKKDILVIVDYTLHASMRRLFVFDMKNKKVLFNTWSQHGYGSDKDNSGFVEVFSNTPGSDQTSLGFILTGETYRGLYGFSMRLDGIDGSFNSKMRSRAVVMHGAGTLTPESAIYKNMGLSQGCITLPIYESGKFYGLEDRPLNEIIINKIKGGSVVFSYSDAFDSSGKTLIESSKWLN